MTGDLFTALEPDAERPVEASFLDEPCELCANDNGLYDWGRVCCRARFITGLPRNALRRGWMDLWRLSESSAFYLAIKKAVDRMWNAKMEALNV